jgi:hypothetical protein
LPFAPPALLAPDLFDDLLASGFRPLPLGLRLPEKELRFEVNECEFPSLLRLKGLATGFIFKNATGYRYCCD